MQRGRGRDVCGRRWQQRTLSVVLLQHAPLVRIDVLDADVLACVRQWGRVRDGGGSGDHVQLPRRVRWRQLQCGVGAHHVPVVRSEWSVRRGRVKLHVRVQQWVARIQLSDSHLPGVRAGGECQLQQQWSVRCERLVHVCQRVERRRLQQARVPKQRWAGVLPEWGHVLSVECDRHGPNLHLHG